LTEHLNAMTMHCLTIVRLKRLVSLTRPPHYRMVNLRHWVGGNGQGKRWEPRSA
jgi:hypothetical protein